MKEQTEVFHASNKLALIFVGIVFGGVSAPIFWVFSHPYDSESKFAILISLLLPIIVFFYTRFKYVVWVSPEKMTFRNKWLMKSSIGVPTMNQVQFIRTHSAYHLEITSKDGRVEYLEMNGFEYIHVLGIIYALKKHNNELKLDQDIVIIIGNFSDKKFVQESAKALEQSDNKKVIWILVVAIAAIIVLTLIAGDKYSFVEIVRLVFSLLE
jgi:hypothetical protein